MELKELNKSLAEVFNSKYIIPLYQRNFSWADEEINQLLQDVYESYIKDRNRNYFIGSLVVLKRRNGDFEVIDGQQRLTVITLISKVLEVSFSKEPKLFYDSRPEVESFFSSFYHTGKTTDVTFDHKVSHLVHAVDIIRETVINPNEKAPKTILTVDALEDFKRFFSNNVILVRVEIPQDTDVANYFEIMNNRGEQLQKHEILKAKLMDGIKTDGEHDTKKQAIFSRIWDACSQMDIPIQRLFFRDDREKYFGQNYDKAPNVIIELQDLFSSESSSPLDSSDEIGNNSIDSILLSNKLEALSSNGALRDIDYEGEDKSIIDFPNFLMHILRLKYNDIYKAKHIGKATESDIPLNEKDLLSVFNSIEESVCSMEFIEAVLYYRTVFDRYIIKASIDEKAEDDYRWSLQKPYKYENNSKSRLNYKNTFESQDRLLKCLSLLQVTFRNRKYKNWLQEILSWFDNKKDFFIEKGRYQKLLDKLLLNYYSENFKDITIENPYNEGTRTPHFLFNYIDYLFWVDSISNPEKYKFDFDFKYRNSVEHHLAQSFRNETNNKMIDNLGNLCLVSKSSNSRMNNEVAVGKADNEDGKYYKLSLPPKQKVMYDLTNNKKSWGNAEIQEHYIDVVNLLLRARDILGIKEELS